MGMVVIQPYILVSKLKKINTKFLHCTGIANSSSCTTTELSKLLTSCLTADKNMLSSIVKRYMRDPVKTLFWSIKNSGEILDKLKARDFRNLISMVTWCLS